MKHMLAALLLAASALVLTSCPSPSDGSVESLDYTSATIGTLKYVPAGSFQRDAEAANISEITQPYRMSATEITREQFLAVMEDDPSDATKSSGTGDPVQRTNWYHAIAFCNKLSIAEGLTPVYSVARVDFYTLTYDGIPTIDDEDWDAAAANWSADGYRLPTEMEWMWAAMAADSGNPWALNTTGWVKDFAGSDGINAVGDYAWTSENSSNKTHPAGTKLPNELGLYDMSGNVWEWCWDWYEDDGTLPNYAITGTVTDHLGAASGTSRVFRGGSWNNGAVSCTVAIRNRSYPNYQNYGLGFRVVRP